MNNKKLVYTFILILAAALIIRIFVAVHTRIPVADSGDYLEIAANLARGNGYQISTWWTYYGSYPSDLMHPDASRQPLFPCLLSIYFWIFKPSFRIVQAVNITFGLLNILLIFLIGNRFFGRPAGLTAAFITAFNAAQIWFSTQAYAESMFTFIFYLLIWYFLTHPENNRKTYFIIGVLTGLLILTRLNGFLIFIAAVISMILRQNKNRKNIFQLIIIIAFGVLIIVSPWLIRNISTFNNPLKTDGGYMNWVDSFQEMQGFHFNPPGLKTYIETHTIKQMLFRYLKGIARSIRGIEIGNQGYHDPYPQGSFALFFFFSIITILYQENKKPFLIVYISFIIHFIFISWTLLGIFRYFIYFYPLMILWGINGILITSKILYVHFANFKRQKTIVNGITVILLFLAVSTSIQPLITILKRDDLTDYSQLMECINWVQSNTSESDVIIDFPVFIEMNFIYNRGTIVVPSGPLDNLIKAINIFDARFMVISSELLEMRPEYTDFFSYDTDQKLFEVNKPIFMDKVFESTNRRFVIYRIDKTKMEI